MNAKKQHGKGLSGFFIGLLLATAVIAGVLFFLNKNGQSSVKELQKSETKAPKPEILVPQGASTHSSEPDALPSSETEIPLSPEKKPLDKNEEHAVEQNNKTPSEEADISEQHAVDGQASQDDDAIISVPQKVQTEENNKAIREQQRQALGKKHAELKKSEATRIAKQTNSKMKHDVDANPTPEQILDSGNMEKARQQARKQAAADAEHKRVEDVLNGRTGLEGNQENKSVSSRKSLAVTNNTASKGGKVIIQIGSYNNQSAADVQRSKLAMAGISAMVAQAEVNGHPVYRVQTNVLGASEASAVQKKLQQRGIASFARSVK